MTPFPVICGPTAGGKSALAVELCLRAPGGGEVVSADAFQVYRGMDIGTAKPTPEERRGVAHHLIDIRDPTEPFSVDTWLRLAEAAIGDIRSRGKLPVVVGGTHLYIKALMDGLFEGPEPDPRIRAELLTMDPADRRAELERVDPAAAARIHPADVRRTVRALEIYRLTGFPISDLQRQWDRGPRPDARLVVLQWPTEALNRRINARVKEMLQRGLVEEAHALYTSGRLGPQAAEAVGYKQLLPVFEGRTRLDDAIEEIKIATRRLGKAQRTWLRRLAGGANNPVSEESGDSPGSTLPDTSANLAATARSIVLDGPATDPERGAQIVLSQLFTSN